MISSLVLASTSKRVFQCQLNLAHRDGGVADHAEALTRSIGRRSGKRRTRENVTLRRTPGGVIQRVKRFQPELEDVLFAMRHPELLMHC